ncbi:MAG: DUF1616 domain-containing protein [Candidatus Bathyarchaeia archaeon]
MKPLRWLEIVVTFTVLTLLVSYLVPSDSPIVALRYVLGFVFIIFLPGYCLINILFLGKNRLDTIEELTLSVALSFGLTGLIGLFLGLSSIGINFVSITVSLGVVVLVLAVMAFVRMSKEKPIVQTQTLPI